MRGENLPISGVRVGVTDPLYALQAQRCGNANCDTTIQ